MNDKEQIYNKTKEIVETLSPYHFKEGSVWYQEALNYCTTLSVNYNVNIKQVVAILSALSPMKEWELNKRQTEQFLIERKCGTFGNQLKKSIFLLDTIIDDLTVEKADKFIMMTLNGRKTQSFYHNIMYPHSSPYVTVDRHMMKLFPDHWPWIITDRRYRLVESVIQEIAAEYHKVPCHLQAALWVKLKTVKG